MLLVYFEDVQMLRRSSKSCLLASVTLILSGEMQQSSEKRTVYSFFACFTQQEHLCENRVQLGSL